MKPLNITKYLDDERNRQQLNVGVAGYLDKPLRELEEVMSHTPDIYTANACSICHEEHEPRSLSYDGKGINACGMYRTRIATFQPDASPELLGPMFAAAPDLLAACEWAERALAPFSKDPAEKSGINLLRAAIAKAKPPSK